MRGFTTMNHGRAAAGRGDRGGSSTGAGLLPGAGLAGNVQLWEWTGDDAARFSYWAASGFIMIATFWQDSPQ